MLYFNTRASKLNKIYECHEVILYSGMERMQTYPLSCYYVTRDFHHFIFSWMEFWHLEERNRTMTNKNSLKMRILHMLIHLTHPTWLPSAPLCTMNTSNSTKRCSLLGQCLNLVILLHYFHSLPLFACTEYHGHGSAWHGTSTMEEPSCGAVLVWNKQSPLKLGFLLLKTWISPIKPKLYIIQNHPHLMSSCQNTICDNQK